MSEPISAPKFDISQHIRYFGTGDVSVGQFYDRAVHLFVPKADLGTHDTVDLTGHVKAAALVAATMPFRGPQSGGSLTTIKQPTIAKSILPGSAGVADKSTGEVTTARIDAFAASVDTNHDGKITMAELQARVNRDGKNAFQRFESGQGWKAIFDITAPFKQTTASGEQFITYEQLGHLYSGDLFFDVAKANGY